MTGVKFLLRVTLRRLDLAAEIYHIREPQKIPQVMSPDETRRVLAVATSLKARAALSLCYGCGLRAGEVVRLKVKHIDSAQKIIRIEQSKGPQGSQRHAVAGDGRSAAAVVEGASRFRSTCCHSRARSPARSPIRARRTSRRHNSPRPCPVQSWRSRISSATTGRRGAEP